MLRCALVVGIAGWLGAQAPAPTPKPTLPTQPTPQSPSAAPTPRAQAEQFVRELAEPGKQNAAVKGLVALGDAAVPALHKALLDRRSEVVQWALFACSGMHVDSTSLRAPVERLLASKDLGVALMARRSWQAVEGRHGVLLTLHEGDVVLVTTGGEEVLLSLPRPFHTELLPNGNLLTVAQTSVRELQADGDEVWSHEGFPYSVDCKRLPDGNTLVCCYLGNGVLELTPEGEVAWSIEPEGQPFEADRLANGNTLITLAGEGSVIEVDRVGKTVWSFPGSGLTSAERLLDGTTLVTSIQSDRILLVGADGKELHSWPCSDPMNAALLPNGHLIVYRRNGVMVLAPDGKTLWHFDREHILGMQVLGAGPFRANAAPASTQPPK